MRARTARHVLRRLECVGIGTEEIKDGGEVAAFFDFEFVVMREGDAQFGEKGVNRTAKGFGFHCVFL